MERMKLTEKEKEQILKSGAEAMSKIIERMSIEMGELEEENKTLKDNVEFLHSCLDDRDKSIAILQEENKNLKEKQKVLDKENCKLIDENVKLKKRIYQNVHGGPRIDYQEFCKKNGI